jgi:hypothetical protein
MKKTIITKLSLLLVFVMMLTLASCNIWGGEPISSTTTTGSEQPQLPEIWSTAKYTEDTELGQGSKTFTFKVEADGYTVTFTIHTDADMVGDALIAHGLIAGDDSQYGLYVKTVNGMLSDWDVDQTYWAFYINGGYGMSGVDTTPIAEGEVYSFVRSK